MGKVSLEDQRYLAEFVESGGSALLATDVDFGPQLIGGHRIRISQGGMVFARYEEDQYQRINAWPIVSRFDPEHPLVSGIRQVVPNFPAFLEVSPRINRGEGWSIVARYPRLFTQGRNNPFVLQYQSPSGGQLVVIPDHSVFVNGSVVVDDNLRFMLNTVDVIREGNRDQCLFVLNGENAAPYNVSNVTLYRPPPGAAETKRALETLWKNTTTRDKIELANEAMEFAQEEQLLEQMVDSIDLNDILTPSQFWKWVLFLSAWCVVITFVVVLVSNRRTPLEGNSADGLVADKKKSLRRREKLERARAAEALFVHFFDRIGLATAQSTDLDPEKVTIVNDPYGTKQTRKDIKRIQADLKRQPMEYWVDSKVEELGRYIAQWANLYETGSLQINYEPAEEIPNSN